MKMYTADFETTTLETNSEETWVWAYGVRELYNKDSFIWGKDINDFMKWCSHSSKHLFFHNLKFDGMFILSWLLENDFEYNHERKCKPKTFKTVITKDTIFYQIEICWKIKGKNVVKTVIQDSYKKLPFTVERIAKAFNLEFQKGDIDYKAIRPRGYEPTKEEIDYLFRDVEIMAQALEIQLDEGLEKMTIGSDSLNVFKDIISTKSFDRYFPVIDKEIDDIIRVSYKGGFTYVNPIHAGKDIFFGQVYDVNSLYPAVMYDKDLPYGLPIRFEGEYKHFDQYPLYVQELTCEFKLKEGYVPTIQIKNDYRFKSTEYLKDTEDQIVQLVLTSVDLKLFFDHYEVFVHEWLGGYMFKSVNGLFKEYIDKYMEIKKTSEGAKRELAKLLLNNLYGKFASSTDATDKEAFLNSEGVLKLAIPTVKEIGPDGIEREVQVKKEKNPVYTAVGAYITSYAREITIRSAQKLGDRFIYGDTDSLHIQGLEPVDLDIHSVDLGKWKFEGEFRKGRFLRAKTYIEDIAQDEKGKDTKIENAKSFKTKVVCAGMNDVIKKQITFDNFAPGNKFYGKLTPKIIKGGVVLMDTYFTIKL